MDKLNEKKQEINKVRASLQTKKDDTNENTNFNHSANDFNFNPFSRK
jgi:hypothetical protein